MLKKVRKQSRNIENAGKMPPVRPPPIPWSAVRPRGGIAPHTLKSGLNLPLRPDH